MRRMQLDDAEASLEGAACSRAKAVDDAADAIDRQRLRLGIVVRKLDRARRDNVRPAALILRQRARTVPRPARTGLAPGVRQLHAGDAALRVNETHDPRERIDVIVAPDTEVLRADPALRQNRGRFRQDERGTADGAATEVNEVPVARKPIAARVLAHRRHEDAIGKGHTTNGQGIERDGT